MQKLIWIDLEMTGLNVTTDFILEIATIVTDADLNILAYGPNLILSQTNKVLDAMDAWNTSHHGKSGLIQESLDSSCLVRDAEQQTLDFLSKWVKPGVSPMCGNSVCQDRRFLAKHMPKLERFFHYRALDVSSLKIAGQLWLKDFVAYDKKNDNHRAMGDVKESIAECKYYKSFLNAI